MKFLINRSDAAAAVKLCMAVVTGRTTLPILSCLLVEAKDNEVRFLATDLDRWMECRVPAQVSKSGSTALSGRILTGIFAKGDDEVSVEVDAKNKATIKSGGSSFKFPGISPLEMPESPSMDDLTGVEMGSHEWLEASRSVKWAASNDTNRITICGTYLTESDGRLMLVATDGSRLSLSRTEHAGFPGHAIIPTDTMSAINVVADHGDALVVKVGNEMISAMCGGAKIISKLIYGDYPNYAAVIPDPARAATKVKLLVKPFLDALDRVSIMLDSKMPSVDLDIGDGRMDISVQREDSKSACSIEAEVAGSPVKVRLAGPKIAEPLRNWDADEVELEIEGGMSPVMFRAPHRSEYVLMPMRIQ